MELEKAKEIVVAMIISVAIPATTAVHGCNQTNLENERKAAELRLAAASQEYQQEREWLQIAVDASRPEAARQQVLRFLEKGDQKRRVTGWAKDELIRVTDKVEDLKKELASAKDKLKANPAEPVMSREDEKLANKVELLQVRLGQEPPPTQVLVQDSSCRMPSEASITPELTKKATELLRKYWSSPFGSKVEYFEVGGQWYSAMADRTTGIGSPTSITLCLEVGPPAVAPATK